MGVVAGKDISGRQSNSNRSVGGTSRRTGSMASSKSMLRKMRGRLIVEKKVWFLGRFHANELSDIALSRLRSHVRIGKGIKTKLRLTTEGIYLGDRMGNLLKNKVPQEFTSLQDLMTIRIDERYKNMLLIVIELGESYFEVLALKTGEDTDASLIESTYNHYLAPRKLAQQQQQEISTLVPTHVPGQENWTVGRQRGLSYSEKMTANDHNVVTHPEWLERTVTLPPTKSLSETVNGKVAASPEYNDWCQPRKVGTSQDHYPRSSSREDYSRYSRTQSTERAQSPAHVASAAATATVSTANTPRYRGVYKKQGDTTARVSTGSDAHDMSTDTIKREIQQLSSEVRSLKKALDPSSNNSKDTPTIVAEVLPTVRIERPRGTPVNVEVENDFASSNSTLRSVADKMATMDTIQVGKASVKVRDYRHETNVKPSIVPPGHHHGHRSLDVPDSSEPSANWAFTQKTERNNNSITGYVPMSMVPLRNGYAESDAGVANDRREVLRATQARVTRQLARDGDRTARLQGTTRRVRSNSNESHARHRRVWAVRPDDEVRSEYGRPPSSTRYARPIEDAYHKYQADYVIVGYRPRAHSAPRFEKIYGVEPL